MSTPFKALMFVVWQFSKLVIASIFFAACIGAVVERFGKRATP